jgi:hypothetical protein
MSRLSSQEISLLGKMDDLLWSEWDPMDQRSQDGSRSEYEEFIPVLYSLRASGASQETIAQKLYDLEIRLTGSAYSMKRCRDIALKIIELEP